MGFWAEKVNESSPAPQAQQGAWWQQGLPQYQQPQAVQQAPRPQAMVQQPAPDNEEELCPRCGSDEYGEFVIENMHGAGGMTGTTKRCWSCAYPGRINASEGVVSGKVNPLMAKATKTKSLRVNERSNFSSWSGDLSAPRNSLGEGQVPLIV